MFHSKRQRQPNPTLTGATANPNAAAAAATAVFRHHGSSSSLSAAAAAAALAARPMTPTRVADVQTKRTLRRSASNASSAASSDNLTRPGLRRRGSSGSMTERTFRSPSPHRPSSSGSGHRQGQSISFAAPEEMPPVPALPRDVVSSAGQPDSGAQQPQYHNRTISLGISSPPLRLASQSLGSEGTRSWFGAAKTGDPRSVRQIDLAMPSPPSSPPHAAQEEQQAEGGRPSSRASSINFSYPTRTRVGSPPVSPVEGRSSSERPQTHQPRQPKQQHRKRHSASASYSSVRSASNPSGQVLVYDPNSRRFLPQADLRAVEQTVSESFEQPASSRRKKQTPQRAGSHLAKGTMGRAKGTALNAGQEKQTGSADVPPKLESHNSVQPSPTRVSEEDLEEPTVKAIISSPRIEAQRMEQHPAPHVKAQFLDPWESKIRRQPSVVKEEQEPESEPEKKGPRKVVEILDVVPARQRVGIETATEANIESGPIAEASPPINAITKEIAPRHEAFKPLGIPNAEELPQLSSPLRQAHFGTVSNNLTVKHSPPPRSISPRKSALKHSASPSRGASPSDDTSEASTIANMREEPPVSRKKSVRVSFNDGNAVVMGESASVDQSGSPLLASPQNTVGRRPWYTSIGRNKKELPPLDDEEIMKPRPALPSFGSVRDRKPRDLIQDEGERPLIRPIAEKTYSSPTSPMHTETTEESRPTTNPLGQSSDHAVGALLAKEYEERSKILANISRFREPLPPVVTSVDGGDYMSDTSSPSESEIPEVAEVVPSTVEPQHSTPGEPQTATSEPPRNSMITGDSAAPVETTQGDSTVPMVGVPTISISQPTPPAMEKSATKSFFLDLPGGFPEDDSDLSTPEASAITTPTVSAAQEPATKAPAVLQAISPTRAEPSSDSESSIYSDAYEDLSELEGDGFQSLNAVLESPTNPKIKPDPLSAEPLSKWTSLPQEHVEPQIQGPSAAAVMGTKPAEPQDEWEKAKAFWRSLTADKRARLEREATEDAGIEGDMEEVKLAQKPKKKKSMERRTSERRALAVHLAQQMVAGQDKERASDRAERSYMIKPGTTWTDEDSTAPTVRTTLRSRPHQQAGTTGGGDAPLLRKSMRANGPSTNSAAPFQTSKTRPLDTTTKRPASLPLQPTQTQNPVANRQTTSEQGSQATNTLRLQSYYPPPIKRRGSTSSESSFKRSRPIIGAQITGFRTSMRQASLPSAQPGKRSSKRFSLRSLSPTSSAFKRTVEAPPVSLTTGAHIRQTLRDSSSERKKSPSGIRIPSFSLSPSSKKAGKRAAGSSRFSSRFADSSDDDDKGGKGGFRSRFEDSSGDEVVSPLVLPKTLPTSLGHLRNQESVASTALPEELEESEELPDGTNNNSDNYNMVAGKLVQPATASPFTQPTVTGRNNTPQPARSGSGRLAASQTTSVLGGTTTVTGGKANFAAERRSSTSRRSSLMSALRRKRPDPAAKISRPEITESAARRDTKLERNLSQLRGIRSTEGKAEDGMEDEEAEDEKMQPPRSPRLQKRIVSLARSMDNADAVAVSNEGRTEYAPSPLALPSSVSVPVGSGDDSRFIRSPLQRPSATASGNLGTRTLSGGEVGRGGVHSPGFLQRRTLSAGIVSLEGAPSVAGTSGTAGKKKFRALRRIFGLDE